ncbi:MAG: PDZ domain-containing protein [Planctomycetes bacterium]|nr:PDZ domain-containing protein [Planctomycetota bacterium]
MNTNTKKTLTAMIGACTALVLACGTANAQDQGEDNLKGSFNQPIRKSGKKAKASDEQTLSSNMTMMVSETEGDDTYTLKMSGDDVSAEINGKKVPQDRIRRAGDKIELLGKNGEVVHTFNVGVQGHGVVKGFAMPRAPIAPAPPEPPDAPDAMMTEPEPPPVMLGLLMNDNEEDDGIVVEEIFPDLPAAKAGLQKGDVILKIDGHQVDEPKDLREILLKKKGGDKVDVVIKRGGGEKTLTLDLAAYDKDAMQKAREAVAPQARTPRAARVPGLPGLQGLMAPEQDWTAEARRAIERAMEQVQRADAGGAEWKAKLQESLAKALAEIEKSSGELRLKVQQWRDEGQGGRTIIGGGGQGGPDHVWVVPGNRMQAGGEMTEKLDRLSESLDRLNKRLDDMEKKIDKKQP